MNPVPTHKRALAAAQTIPVPGDVETNLERHAAMVEVAVREGARVIVFPEMSLTGYEPDRARALAFSGRDPRLEPLTRLAQARGVTLIVGAPVRMRERLHVGAFVLMPDGTHELYTKRHLGDGEDAVFHPGDRDPLIRCGGGTGAVAVCADANHPSHPEAAAGRGARTYLVSTFIEPSELRKKTGWLEEYASRHSMVVVFANSGGPSGGLVSAGRSAIWSEYGELLSQLDGPGAGLAVALEDDGGWRAKTITVDQS